MSAGRHSGLLHGVLLIDKEPGPTSHDVVASCRRILRERHIGHLGTLDPIAGGLLPMAIGKATRLTRFFLMDRKTYRGKIRLGFSTDTYDSAGQPTSETAGAIPDRAAILEAASGFHGRIRHGIPAYSARKVGGRKLYELARKGEVIAPEFKEVEIYTFDVGELQGDLVEFVADCSSGTYVRTLAHELGAKLGCGAHLESLRRLKVGEFSIENAVTLDRLRDAATEGHAAEMILPTSRLLGAFTSIPLSGAEIGAIANGKDILRKLDSPSASRFVKLVSATDGSLAAVGEIVDQHALLVTIHPAVVLAHN